MEETARSAVLLATILILVYWATHQPAPVKDNQVPYCSQPIWGRHGMQIGAMFVPCNILDRYEDA